MGHFDNYFALNTTSQNVAYFLTGNFPPRRTNASNWLRIVPQLGDLSPFVAHLATGDVTVKSRILIADISSGRFCMPVSKWCCPVPVVN